MTTVRVFIAEWHFGDERWVFDVGSRLNIDGDVLDADHLRSLHEIWEEESLRDLRYEVEDGACGKHRLDGVITSIVALECRFPSRAGGRPIPRSGTARQVRQARGWTGDVDASLGLIEAFVIDIQLDD